MKNYSYYCLLLILIIFYFYTPNVNAQKHSEYSMLNITLGQIGTFDSDQRNNRYGLEYRTKPITKWNLIPAYGFTWSTQYSRYLYTELKHDWSFKKHWIITSSLGVGIFDNNNNIDLGHPIEFRSGFELSFKFKKGYRLGIAAYHLSNSRISSENPGTESIVMSISIPLKNS